MILSLHAGVAHQNCISQFNEQQKSEYKKLQNSFDTVVHFLAQSIDPEFLADRLFAAELINEGLVEKACVKTVVNSERVRPLVKAILAQVQINPEKYYAFISILHDIKGAEDLVQHLETVTLVNDRFSCTQSAQDKKTGKSTMSCILS